MDPSSLAKTISAVLSLDLVPGLINLYRSIRQLVEHESHEGLFEVLEYDATLELLDTKG